MLCQDRRQENLGVSFLELLPTPKDEFLPCLFCLAKLLGLNLVTDRSPPFKNICCLIILV